MSTIEFEQVTITYRRRHAANQIAHFYRSKKILSEIRNSMRHVFLEYLKTNKKPDTLKKLKKLEQQFQLSYQKLENKKIRLQEKILQIYYSRDFNQQLQRAIHNHHYQHLPFDDQHFMKFLLGAFEESIINKNQFLTISLLYTALDLFKVSPEQLLHFRMMEGPFQPDKIHYWKPAHQKQLNENHPENYDYFAIPIPNLFLENLISKMIQKNCQIPKLNLLIALLSKNKLHLKNHDIVCSQIDEQTQQSIDFLLAIEELEHQMPSIMVDDDQAYFIILSIDTYNLLSDILFKEESIYPCPIIGRFTTRLVRALDEIPSLNSADLITPAQNYLSSLFPISKSLHKPHRPVEIYYPGVPFENAPHGFEAHPFMLSWHDLFHTWRASENNKSFIRRMRLFFDSKLNYNPHPEKAMSEIIWKLSDIDCSAGLVYHEDRVKQPRLDAFNLLIKNLIFNEKELQIPENYLFIYHYLKNPSYWEPLPYVTSIDNYFQSIQNFNLNYSNGFLNNYQRCKKYIELNPEASWIQFYFYDNINPQTKLELELIQILDEKTSQDIFTWPNLEVEYQDHFYKKHLQQFGFDKTLAKNPPHTLYFCLMLVYMQKNQSFESFSVKDLNMFISQLHEKQIEYFIIESVEILKAYLKKYRPELSSTWIDTCEKWSLEERKDVIYSQNQEPYYILKFQHQISQTHLLSLCQAFPKWAGELVILASQQEESENKSSLSNRFC